MPEPAPCPRPRRLPRPETVLLLLALLWSIGGKALVLRRSAPDELASLLAAVSLSDLVFFSAALLLMRLSYLLPRPGLVARLNLGLAGLILLYALMNTAWLMATRVQLQPDVLAVLIRNPVEFAPLVTTHVQRKLVYALPLLVTGLAALGWFAWRLIRPAPPPGAGPPWWRPAAPPLAVLLPAALAHALWPVPPDNGYEREVLGFSSHWYALVHATLGGDDAGDVHGQVRRLPRQGERDLTPPAAAEPRPNVVIVLLESVGHCYTSLHDPTLDTTPHLRRLAEEGAEFVTTRVPVSDTAKAFWTTFTGVTPDIQPDHAEAVLTDRPYESLATILARQGYRSAFFEMSKGAFECTPGLFANLGFDHAWFRENLQDESAHLGYFNGDDFRMIEPMFRWVDSGPGPFLLTMITSVSHDPYELPAWYGETAGDNRQRFLRAIRFGDDFLQRVDQELAARGLDRNTILCVIGDHGTDFGDRSEASRWMPFEPVIRVPWVLRWPGRIDPGRRVETPCSQLDVTPTLLRLLGYDVARAGFDGEDALDPALAPGRRFYFATWYARSPRGFVEGDRKLIYWPYRGTLFEYDLARDPGEERETILEGEARAEAVRDIERWRALSMVHIPARRFRERRVFEHWQTWCVGRYPRAHYVSQPAAASSERGDG